MQKLKRHSNIVTAENGRQRGARHRASQGRIKRLLNKLKSRISIFFTKNEKRKSSFTSSDKAKSAGFFAGIKNWFIGRKYRRLIFCIGGCAIVTALLIVLLVPGAEAATVQPEMLAEAGAVGAFSVEPTQTPVDKVSGVSEPSETIAPPVETTEPEPVATTPPESTPTPEQKPVDTATSEPTPTEKPEPVATTKPDPTKAPIDINELVEEFKVEADLYYNEVGYSSNAYEYTDEELHVLAQVIDGEAGHESTKGKIAVGNVIMNRVLASGYPGNDIIEVVTASGQFSGYSSSNKPSSKCIAAAHAVLDDQVWVIPQHSFNFNSSEPKGEDWGNHTYYTRIGNHNFYVDKKYRGRCQKASEPPALFERTYKWPQYGCEPGSRVYRVQAMLKALDYDVSPDKYFGKSTKDALKEFQSDKGLEADGVAGPSTLKKLIKEYGLSDYYHDFCE